jgi:RES domain
LPRLLAILGSRAPSNFSVDLLVAAFDFSSLTPPPIKDLSGPWFRVHQTSYAPVYFGRSATNRCDSPDGSYGVLYLGESWRAAFMESALHDPTAKVVVEADLATRSMALMSSTVDLRVVDVADGITLRALGISATNTQGPYSESQAISKAIYSAGWNVRGIRYRSKLDNGLICLALFDFPATHLPLHDLGNLVSGFNRNLVAAMLRAYNIALI